MLNLADYRENDKALDAAARVFMEVMNDLDKLMEQKPKTEFRQDRTENLPAAPKNRSALSKDQLGEYQIEVLKRSFAELRSVSVEQSCFPDSIHQRHS